MKSRTVVLSEGGRGILESLDIVEWFCESPKQELDRKQILQMRLLAEELMGMMKGIVGSCESEFWIEKVTSGYEMHVRAQKTVDRETKAELLSVSKSGKNFDTKGVMGKVRAIVEWYMSGCEEMDRYYMQAGVAMPYLDAGFIGTGAVCSNQTWSLQQYMDSMESEKAEMVEQWDELEKSIVAKLADDVLVGVRNGKVEIIVKKEF